MFALEKHLKSSSIDEKLLHLIKLLLRNQGCAYCIDMHSKDAARRIPNAPLRFERLAQTFFHPRERAASPGRIPTLIRRSRAR